MSKTSPGRVRRAPGAVQQVAGDEGPEEEALRGQEGPHAELLGVDPGDGVVVLAGGPGGTSGSVACGCIDPCSYLSAGSLRGSMAPPEDAGQEEERPQGAEPPAVDGPEADQREADGGEGGVVRPRGHVDAVPVPMPPPCRRRGRRRRIIGPAVAARRSRSGQRGALARLAIGRAVAVGTPPAGIRTSRPSSSRVYLRCQKASTEWTTGIWAKLYSGGGEGWPTPGSGRPRGPRGPAPATGWSGSTLMMKTRIDRAMIAPRRWPPCSTGPSPCPRRRCRCAGAGPGGRGCASARRSC